jgi:hypothetical protein
MFTFDETYVESVDAADIWVSFRHHFTDKFSLFGAADYRHLDQEQEFTFILRDDMGVFVFSDGESTTWEEGDTSFHLGIEYVADNFTLDAVYEPEASSSSIFRGGLGSPNLPGTGRNSVTSDRVTFGVTFNW